MKSIVAAAFVVLFCASCGGIVIHSYPTPPSDDDIIEVIWETSGGGHVEFEIVPDGMYYKVHVSRRQFRDVDVTLQMKIQDDYVYPTVQQIFLGQRDLSKDTFQPEGQTGSWTTITLVHFDGSRHEFKNIKAWGELRVIPSFVDRALGEG